MEQPKRNNNKKDTAIIQEIPRDARALREGPGPKTSIRTVFLAPGKLNQPRSTDLKTEQDQWLPKRHMTTWLVEQDFELGSSDIQVRAKDIPNDIYIFFLNQNSLPVCILTLSVRCPREQELGPDAFSLPH